MDRRPWDGPLGDDSETPSLKRTRDDRREERAEVTTADKDVEMSAHTPAASPEAAFAVPAPPDLPEVAVGESARLSGIGLPSDENLKPRGPGLRRQSNYLDYKTPKLRQASDSSIVTNPWEGQHQQQMNLYSGPSLPVPSSETHQESDTSPMTTPFLEGAASKLLERNSQAISDSSDPSSTAAQQDPESLDSAHQHRRKVSRRGHNVDVGDTAPSSVGSLLENELSTYDIILGVGWQRPSLHPDYQASKRGIETAIRRKYSLPNPKIDGIHAARGLFVVEADSGWYLLKEDLSEGIFLNRNMTEALDFIKFNPECQQGVGMQRWEDQPFLDSIQAAADAIEFAPLKENPGTMDTTRGEETTGSTAAQTGDENPADESRRTTSSDDVERDFIFGKMELD